MRYPQFFSNCASNKRREFKILFHLAVAFFCVAILFKLPKRQFTKKNSRTHTDLAKIVSFSLYGQAERYTTGALVNSELFGWAYPGWRMRIYYNSSVSTDIIRRLRNSGVQLIDMTWSDMNPMNWRFLAASDPSIAVSCFRDIDSRLGLREFAAVSAWIESGENVHMIRDHPGHKYHPLMGGMWCIKAGVILNMTDLIEKYSKAAHFNADQEFLRAVVWPLVNSSVLQHAAFGCGVWPGTLPMPTPRVGTEHVGAVYLNGVQQYTNNFPKVDECE